MFRSTYRYSKLDSSSLPSFLPSFFRSLFRPSTRGGRLVVSSARPTKIRHNRSRTRGHKFLLKMIQAQKRCVSVNRKVSRNARGKCVSTFRLKLRSEITIERIQFLFCSILFYSVPLYSILFYSILFYSILFYPILSYSIFSYSILFYSVLFRPVPFSMSIFRKPFLSLLREKRKRVYLSS